MARANGGGAAKGREQVNPPDRQRKAALREEIRSKLNGLTEEEHRIGSALIRERLEQQQVWKSARTLLAFVPIGREPDIWPSVTLATRAGKQVALLRYAPEADCYRPCLVQDPERDLQEGRYGILEPKASCPIFDLMRLDLALVPGIGFTLDGGRLGRGKGYYDRLLAGVPAMKCGLAFDCQIAGEFPLEPHDVRLNCILTPTRWHLVGGRARF